ncbi:MAG: hypothetical protein H0U89_09855 [Acidimicrobiia bacterium]|nr:hypothetical protein [Acidimicrobiia bacterium]
MADVPTLDSLLRSVRTRSDEALVQLEVASQLAAELGDLGDALLNHFVDQCRRAGHSWAQIGEHLGVTRQAAQQRFVPAPGQAVTFERFTMRARTALEQSAEAARRLGHGYVGTEHVLLALFEDEEALARKVLDRLGVDRAAVEGLLVARIPRGKAPVEGHLSFTPRVGKVLEETVNASLDLGHNYVGTEHILLGLYRGQDGLAKQFLEQLGASREQVRDVVVEMLSGYIAGRGG